MTTVIVNGLFVGLVYGLLAVGLVVIYRGSRIINFAYGETGMIGAFVFSELWVDHHAPLLLATAVANITFHSLIGHKEYSFIFLSVVLFIIIAALGSADWIQWLRTKRAWRWALPCP